MASVFTPLYLQYPAWIKPQVFPGIPVLGLIRWYGLMYIVAFALAFVILRKQYKEGVLNEPNRKTTEDDVFGFIAFSIICLLIGARVLSTLVYDTSGIYRQKPWLIFWPFDPDTHKFTGLAGMSYHGGFIGGLLGMIIWCLWHKRPLWKWVDAIAVSIPLGYTFGRLGNFMNGELYGRITTVPWGMIFPRAAVPGESFSATLPWVQEFAAKVGLVIQEGERFVNLPRHPSQLYEAFGEGILLFIIIFALRKKKPFDGFLACIYTIGYGVIRFIIEYFRQPDADLGYRISKDGSTIIYENNSLLNISTGQVFCFIMIVGGLLLMLALFFWDKYKKKHPEKFEYKGDDIATKRAKAREEKAKAKAKNKSKK